MCLANKPFFMLSITWSKSLTATAHISPMKLVDKMKLQNVNSKSVRYTYIRNLRVRLSSSKSEHASCFSPIAICLRIEWGTHTYSLSLTHRQMEFILHGCCAKYSSVDNLHVDCTYCGVCNSDSIPVFKEICSMCLWKLFDRRRRRCSCCYCYFHALPFYCWLLCVVCLSCYRACWQFTTFPYRLKTNSISIINNLQMLILNDSQYKWHAKTRDASRTASKHTHAHTHARSTTIVLQLMLLDGNCQVLRFYMLIQWTWVSSFLSSIPLYILFSSHSVCSPHSTA